MSLIVEKTDGTVFSLLNIGVMATKTPGLQSRLCQADKHLVTVGKKLILNGNAVQACKQDLTTANQKCICISQNKADDHEDSAWL